VATAGRAAIIAVQTFSSVCTIPATIASTIATPVKRLFVPPLPLQTAARLHRAVRREPGAATFSCRSREGYLVLYAWRLRFSRFVYCPIAFCHPSLVRDRHSRYVLAFY